METSNAVKSVMRDQYDALYEQLEELIPGLRELKPEDARKSESRGFMDLHLDVLTRSEEELVIALHHSFRQGGDTIPDPDMQIRIYLIEGWNKAEALTYQDQFRSDVVYPEPGKVNPRMKRSLNSFLKQWLTNLKNQGHSLAPNEEKAPEPNPCDDCTTGIDDCEVWETVLDDFYGGGEAPPCGVNENYVFPRAPR